MTVSRPPPGDCAQGPQAEGGALLLSANQSRQIAAAIRGFGGSTPKGVGGSPRALEAAGVEFIDENGGGPGVRLRKRQQRKGSRGE